MSFSIGGLGSGLDTQSLVAQLVSAESIPQNSLKTKLSLNTVKSGSWTALSTIVADLQAKGKALTGTDALAGSSVASNSDQVTATSAATAVPGSLTFKVLTLAAAHQLVSTVPSPTTVVGASTTVVSAGLAAVGATTITAGSTPVTAKHSVVVSGAASPAFARGTVPSGIIPTGTTLELSVGGGTPLQIDLGGAAVAGAAGLRDHVQTQLKAAGFAGTVEINGDTIQFKTTATGTGSSLTVGGAGATELGMTAGTTTGDSLTVTADGKLVALDRSGATPALTLSDGTRVDFAGEPTAGTLSMGIAVTAAGATMADVTAELAKAGGPASSALVDSGAGGTDPYRLVMSASATGTAGALTISSTLAALSSVTDLRPPADADILLGDGGNTVHLTRSSNTITDLMPGVTLNLVTADPTKDVTVSVRPDSGDAVGKVADLVTSLNGALSYIKSNSQYDVEKKTGGPLVGEGGARELSSALMTAMGTAADGPLRVANQIGIAVQRDGSFLLDQSALHKAMADDPDSVNRVLTALATAVTDVSKAATDPGGAVAVGLAGTDARAKDIQSRIDDWDTRLVAIQARYTKQFNALDVAMSKLNSQKQWLTGQLNGLSSS